MLSRISCEKSTSVIVGSEQKLNAFLPSTTRFQSQDFVIQVLLKKPGALYLVQLAFFIPPVFAESL